MRSASVVVPVIRNFRFLSLPNFFILVSWRTTKTVTYIEVCYRVRPNIAAFTYVYIITFSGKLVGIINHAFKGNSLGCCFYDILNIYFYLCIPFLPLKSARYDTLSRCLLIYSLSEETKT